MVLFDKTQTTYKRLETIEVKVGNIIIGSNAPIRIQTMTTTDTMNTLATVEQSIRCIEAGAELIRITAPSKKEAENLLNIKNELKKRGYHTPLIADIHFTPNAAELAAKIVEKVRINPGNYIDKKKFETIEYSDLEYQNEIERIRNRLLPLLKICKEYGTAMRIGTNHGSLSDRILSRYGDTPMGMVESAMEFLRIAVDENYQQIILSMKASNPLVMVQAYRLLVQKMQEEFNFCFPLHLGVTEAGDGEDGRIKSAIGIGTLLEDGIGDTIRVSLTEDPEFEVPVCQDIVKRYTNRGSQKKISFITNQQFNPFQYQRSKTLQVNNIGGENVPIVISDWSQKTQIKNVDFESVGYHYEPQGDKWNIKEDAVDYIFVEQEFDFDLPKSLKFIVPIQNWKSTKENSFPLFTLNQWKSKSIFSPALNFIEIEIDNEKEWKNDFNVLASEKNIVLISKVPSNFSYLKARNWILEKINFQNQIPIVWKLEALNSQEANIDEQLIHFSTEIGALLLDGFGDGIYLYSPTPLTSLHIKGRTYLETKDTIHFLNNISFSILQATRTRISKTEYISCPSCGRTLFDLQETTTKIRNATKHLKGVKIAVMGCIVNGPGEMADADFGYVGSGIGKIHLYKNKEIVKKNIPSEIAVEELIELIKENNRWND